MEGNNAQNMPVNCANGCGLYGNPINNNMCSKCFKGTSQTSTDLPVDPAATVTSATSSPQPLLDTPMTEAVTPLSSSTSPLVATSLTPVSVPQPQPSSQPLSQPMSQPAVNPIRMPLLTPVPAPELAARSPALSQATKAEEKLEPGVRPVQTNKGRCFMCRAKIPLAKQTINKCRCEYIFCDTHKTTSKHDCDFDYAKMDRDLLAKNNPKLNDKPRGGRSFTRLD